MNLIKSALKVLCNDKNVRGALIITKDGMVIESILDKPEEAEAFGAFMSNIALTIQNSLTTLGHNEFNRYVIQSNHGRIFLVDLGASVLIAMTDVEVDMGQVNVSLFQAANQVKKMGRLDV